MATAPFTFTGLTFSVGWILALVVLTCVWAGFMFGRIDLPLAFVVSAICAVRL